MADLLLPTTTSRKQHQQHRKQRQLADAPSPSPAVANTTTTIVVDSNSTLLTTDNYRRSLADRADKISKELDQELSKELELLALKLFPRDEQLDDCEVQMLFDDDDQSPVDHQGEVAGGDESTVAELRAVGTKRRRSSCGRNDRRSREEKRKARRESRSRSKPRRSSSSSGSSVNDIEMSRRHRRRAFVSTGTRNAATRVTRTTSGRYIFAPSTSSGSADSVARCRQGFSSASGARASATVAATTPAVKPRRRLRARSPQPSSGAKRPEPLRQERSLAHKADAYKSRSGAGGEGHAAPGASTGNNLSRTSRSEEMNGVRRRDTTSFNEAVVSSSVQTRAVLTTAAVGTTCAVVASARRPCPLVSALCLSAVHVAGSATWALRVASSNGTVLARRLVFIRVPECLLWPSVYRK